MLRAATRSGGRSATAAPPAGRQRRPAGQRLSAGQRLQLDPRVLHLANPLLQEKAWNAYYAHLLARLCTAGKGHKMTLQVGLSL